VTAYAGFVSLLRVKTGLNVPSSVLGAVTEILERLIEMRKV
jgi:hypothetical protein